MKYCLWGGRRGHVQLGSVEARRAWPPICPEHGCQMAFELQPLWWRGKCGCPIRVMDEDRRGYVPAQIIRWVSSLRPDYKIARPGPMIWRLL